MSIQEITLRMAMAVVVGGVIGYEREKGESLVYHHEYRIDLRKEKIPEERIMHGLKAIGEFSLLELTDMHEELE